MIYLLFSIIQIVTSFIIYKLISNKLTKSLLKKEETIPIAPKVEVIDDGFQTLIPNYTPIKFVPVFEVKDKHKRNIFLSLSNNIDIWYVRFDSISSYFINNKISDKIYLTIRKDLGETNLVVNSIHYAFTVEQNNYIQPLIHNLISSYEKINSIKQLNINKSINDDFDEMVNKIDLRDDKFDQLGI